MCVPINWIILIACIARKTFTNDASINYCNDWCGVQFAGPETFFLFFFLSSSLCSKSSPTTVNQESTQGKLKTTEGHYCQKQAYAPRALEPERKLISNDILLMIWTKWKTAKLFPRFTANLENRFQVLNVLKESDNVYNILLN